jgi:hypothetical protein
VQKKKRTLSELASDKKVTPAGGKELLFVNTEFTWRYPTLADVFACAWKNEPAWLNTEEHQEALKYIDLQLYAYMYEDTYGFELPSSVGRIMRVENI